MPYHHVRSFSLTGYQRDINDILYPPAVDRLVPFLMFLMLKLDDRFKFVSAHFILPCTLYSVARWSIILSLLGCDPIAAAEHNVVSVCCWHFE